MSAGFLTDPKVEQLGLRHGPIGPLVIVSLFSHAALQEAGGEVERTYRALAHEVFSDVETVAAVVDDAVDVALCRVVSRDVHGFKLSFPAWKRHQATGRKAKEREARKALEQANVTDSHAVSRDVANSTRQDSKNVTPRKEEAPLSYLLADLIEGNGSKRPIVTKTWATEEDRMLRLDKRPPNEAEKLIRWCQRDSFWRQVIQSMPKFREQYDKMRLKAIAERQGSDPARSSDTLAKIAAREA